MKHTIVSTLFSLLAAVPNWSPAATVLSYGDGSIQNTGGLIADILPTAFDATLNAAGLVIVVQYDSTVIGSDRICHVVAGVSRNPTGDATAHIPALRAVQTRVMRNDPQVEGDIRRQCTGEAIRGAIRALTNIPLSNLLSGATASVRDTPAKPVARLQMDI